MTVKGYWTETHYVPEPSVRRLEQELGKIAAARPCAKCGEPLGPGPDFVKNHRRYHGNKPECNPHE